MTSGSESATSITTWRSPFVILVCGTLILLISFGARQVFGLLMSPVSADLGWGREVFSFAVAMQALVWGIVTPFAGAIADKYGAGRVVAVGGVLYAAGLIVMARASEPIDAMLGVGVLTGFAMAATMFPIVLAVIARATPLHRRGLYLGIASAGGSSGMFLTVPAGQLFISAWGWPTALIAVAGLTALIVPLAAAMASGPPKAEAGGHSQSLSEAVREAGTHVGYLLLTLAYFVCGFQTMFIGAHLVAMLTDGGISAEMGAVALSLIGLFNIVGCFVWGLADGKFRTKYLLCWLYFVRSIVMAVFFILPFSDIGVIVFACIIGALWLATVPLTSAVVAQIFGVQYMATIYGFSFFSHQIGSFLGIWLGGALFDATGSYATIWWIAVALGFIASALHYPIDDQTIERPAMRAAAAE